MDNRNLIIQNVTAALKDRIPEDTIIIIQDVLCVELDQYEVQDRCTELAPPDNAESMLRKFIATKRIEGLSESTLKYYALENMKLIEFLHKPLEDVTTYDLRFYLSYRRESSNLSNRTLDNMRRCFSSFFGFLASEDLIPSNPCLALSQIKYRKTVKKPFSSTEMERLREACQSDRDIALLDFLYSTGCRVSEVVQLDISDVDFEKGECLVVGKGDKERIVYLSDVALMHLKTYLINRRDSSPALFAGKGTNRISKNGIEAILRRLGDIAGVEDVHPHRYRRTLATNMLDRGMPMQDVAKILGHSDLKTTQIYCYVDQNNVKSAYQNFVN